MDDLGQDVGRSIGNLGSCAVHGLAALALTAVLAAVLIG